MQKPIDNGCGTTVYQYRIYIIGGPMINFRHIGNSGIRFVVLKTVKLDAWRARIEIEHSYVGIIELEQIANSTNLLNRRVLPIPVGGLHEELLPVYMWQEAMTLFELIDYLD